MATNEATEPTTERVAITRRQADLLARFQREADAAEARYRAALKTMGAAVQTALAAHDVRGTVTEMDTDADPPVLVVEVEASGDGEGGA
ncbi:MAG: hypothetical protein ACOC9N_03725 [Gemmatimonadota bacterium]